MTWRAWLVLSLIVSAPVSGCRTQKVEHPAGGDEPDPEALEAATGDVEGETGDAAEASAAGSEGDELSVEEQLAIETMQAHLSRTAPSDSPQAPSDSPQAPGDSPQAPGEQPQPPAALEFVVVQQGPAQPWVMGIINRGEHNARLVADPRLLSFQVNVPGKKKPVTCELPDPLRPTRAHARYGVWLEPGEGVVKAFDPRLYCFAASGQQVLVPGAIVTPKFGWSEKVKTVWKGGKKQQVPVAQTEPFIARIDAPSEPHAAAQPQVQSEATAPGILSSSESDEDRGTVAVKGLHAPPIALNSEYQAWSAAALPRPAKTDAPIAIDMQQGSDAASDLYATVEVTLKNKSRQTQYVYFRRELLNLEVMGPGGAASCDPEPDTRAPDRQAFLRLAPGQRMSIPSRLVELCPKDTFARPGFYLVHARFEAAATGEQFGLEAYVGRVATEHPANVRIRSGELAPSELEAMHPVQLLE